MSDFVVTAKIQIKPPFEYRCNLNESMEQYRRACNRISAFCFETRLLNQAKIQEHLYEELRALYGLKSQMACSAIRTVIARYRTILETQHVDANTICMKPRIASSAKQLRGMTTVKDDGITTVSARGCAELINDAVLTAVNDLEGQCRKILEKYPNTTYQYTSGNGSPTVDAPDFSKAISYLEQIRELAGSAEDEANALYKGKDVFGGEYKVNAAAVKHSCETMISHLSHFKGQELDGTKSPDRKLLEEASSDTWITEDFESLWRTLCAMDVSLNQFLGSGFSKKASIDLDFSDIIPLDFYGAETEELEAELDNLNLMRPAGELVVKILNAMKNNGWVLIHPSTGRNETVFSDVAREIVREYDEGEEAETSVRKFNLVYPAPSIEL